MPDQLWYCTRQRAGPLVKECRAIRPRLSSRDTREDARSKKEIIRYAHSAVCRSPTDRLELRLALFDFEGTHYILTFDDDHLPRDFAGVRKVLRAFQSRCRRWRHNQPYDWIYAIEGLHGDHRWHVHMVLRYGDFSPLEVQYLWRQGSVDDEPVLRKNTGYRDLAEYLTKERSDGYWIPVGRHPWSCSRNLNQRLLPPEKWMDDSGFIEVPDDVLWTRKNQNENSFGSYYYRSFILGKDAPARVRARLS